MNLEQRVAQLEMRLDKLQSELTTQRPQKDWRRAVGAFTDDEGVQSILHDAMRMREAERKKARSKATKKRKPSQ